MNNIWDLFFNGFGVGIILVPPLGRLILLSYHLNFLCTNNITKCEAPIVKIKETLSLKTQHFHIFGDSQLIKRQVTRNYQAKQLKLSQYHDLASSLLQKFSSYTIDPLPQNDK